MSFKWQDQHTTLFLEAYQRYECLWNPKSANYLKTSARENAYFSMLQDLDLPGLTVDGVKAKIKTIRTRYGAELAKVRSSEKSGAGSDELYEPRLFWFKDADVFLRAVCSSKASLKSHDVKKWTENSSDSATNATSLDNAEHEDDALHVATSFYSPGGRTAEFTKSRKHSLNTPVPTIHNAIKKLKRISDEIKQDQNEFDAFCNSLAIQLKNMPLHRALICQENLQKVMTQERLSQIEQPASWD